MAATQGLVNNGFKAELSFWIICTLTCIAPIFSMSWSVLEAPRSTELTPSFLRHHAGDEQQICWTYSINNIIHNTWPTLTVKPIHHKNKMFYLKQNMYMYIQIKPFPKLKQLLLPLLHTLKHLTKHTAVARPLCYHGSQHRDTLSMLKIFFCRKMSDICRSAEEVKRSHADRCRSLNTAHATPPPHTDRKETLWGFESLLGVCLCVCVSECVPSVALCVGTAVCLLYCSVCVCL